MAESFAWALHTKKSLQISFVTTFLPISQLPMNLYQIQTKYRDEARPRFGLMRSREFIMKDAYSFDRDYEGLDKSYQEMYDAYDKIFTRCGLTFRPVEADTGAIGGSNSHEFTAISEVGESEIAYCEQCCDMAATVERAECEDAAPQTECRSIAAGRSARRREQRPSKTLPLF